MLHPIIGIPCDIKTVGALPFHAVGVKYVTAASEASGGTPLLIPALGDMSRLLDVLPLLDGVLLSGSPSNIEPHHYGGAASREGTLHDPARDATTLPLVELLLAEGIPLLGICRGFQEINVALGGELHQHVQEQPGLRDHREPESPLLEDHYAPSHDIHFDDDSLLHSWLGTNSATVNSLHQQGIKRLAERLIADAHADDGLVEAYRVRDAKTFAYAVQWHPEWKYWDNPVSQAIFNAFGDACRERRASKMQG